MRRPRVLVGGFWHGRDIKSHRNDGVKQLGLRRIVLRDPANM